MALLGGRRGSVLADGGRLVDGRDDDQSPSGQCSLAMAGDSVLSLTLASELLAHSDQWQFQYASEHFQHVVEQGHFDHLQHEPSSATAGTVPPRAYCRRLTHSGVGLTMRTYSQLPCLSAAKATQNVPVHRNDNRVADGSNAGYYVSPVSMRRKIAQTPITLNSLSVFRGEIRQTTALHTRSSWQNRASIVPIVSSYLNGSTKRRRDCHQETPPTGSPSPNDNKTFCKHGSCTAGGPRTRRHRLTIILLAFEVACPRDCIDTDSTGTTRRQSVWRKRWQHSLPSLTIIECMEKPHWP